MDMFFPPQYKKSLLRGIKNVTVRTGAEREKYKVGKVYNAKSYAGRDWGVKVKILKVIPTSSEKLSEYISERSAKPFKGKVEVIRFKVVN